MNRKNLVVISAVSLGVILMGAGTLFLVKALSRPDDGSRQNKLALAGEYIEAGEYSRALDILDGLLIENNGDQEARKFRDLAVQAAARTAEDGQAAEKALADERAAAAEKLARELAQALAAAGTRDGDSAGEERRWAVEERRRVEEERRQLAEEDRQRREEEMAETRAAAEAERKAAAEAEAARRRAEEAEMARLSAEKQERMRAVNDLVSQGRRHLERGEFTQAEAVFLDAYSRLPPDEKRFEAQKRAEAAEAWYEAAARRPDLDKTSRDSLLTQARKEARSAIEADGRAALPHFTQGKIYRDLKQTDTAAAELKEAVRLEPENYLYSFELGRIYFSNRQYADARQAFETVTQLKPDMESAWYNLGGGLRALGRQDEALAAYRRAAALKPDYTAAYREIGRILSAKGDSAGAAAAFNSALQYNGRDLASLRELGALQSGLGDFWAAETLFSRALAVEADHGLTNYNMAIVKLALDKTAEALSFAQRAVDKTPESAPYVYTLGQVQEGLGDWEKAAASYTKAASLDAGYVKPRINLGRLCLENGLPAEALRFLTEAYRVEPNNPDVNNNLGAVYASQERWEESLQYYERALAQDPNHSMVRLNLARAYVGAGRLDRARDTYRDFLRLEKDNWEAILELGKTCVSLGEAETARLYLQDLLKRNPSHPGSAEAERILAAL
jgi:tetratricopeptide (TPR) repeat protein